MIKIGGMFILLNSVSKLIIQNILRFGEIFHRLVNCFKIKLL